MRDMISDSCSPGLCRVPFFEDYFDSRYFETTLPNMQQLIIASIKGDPHLVPFFCSGKGRYRSTVLATCLFSLYKAGSLQVQDVRVLQNQILKVRTTAVQNDPTPAPRFQVLPEDTDAWCVTETPSVWSTAYSIWSLVETGYDGSENATIANACRWLTHEAHPEGGWGYNLYPQTPPTVYLTSIAVKALVHCVRNAARYGLSNSDVIEANKKILDGVAFLLKCRCFDQDAPIPLFKTRPCVVGARNRWDLVSTVWAYQIILEHGQRAEREIVEKHREGLFNYLSGYIKRPDAHMPISFVDEALTKYQRSKKYQYYQPSLLINLLKMGLSPLHPLAFSFLDWLKSTIRPDGVTSDYHPTEATSFATALAIQTVHTWSATIAKSVEPLQEVCLVANTEFPKVKRNLEETERQLETAQKHMESIAGRETLLLSLTIVLTVLFVGSLVGTGVLLVNKPDLGVGIWASMIGGGVILAVQLSVSFLLRRRRKTK